MDQLKSVVQPKLEAALIELNAAAGGSGALVRKWYGYGDERDPVTVDSLTLALGDLTPIVAFHPISEPTVRFCCTLFTFLQAFRIEIEPAMETRVSME